MSRVPKWRSSLYAVLIFGGIALGFTLLGMLSGPSEAQVGGTRPENTILPHIAELTGFGLLLGLGSMVIYGKRGLPLVFLTPALTVLLDVDHLPAYLGYPEPIRPAHSLVFIFFALAVTAITIKELDIELVVASAIMAHMAVDRGLFAPFSPLSFVYVQLDPYSLPFAIGAVVLAVAAGAVLRMRSKARPVRGAKDV